MPTFKYEAMDTTGGEVKDTIDAANEEEAQQKIRQMGYFVTKITERGQEGKARRRQEEGRQAARSKTVHHRRRLDQAALHLHPPVLDPAGRRPADPAQPARSSKARCKPGVLKNALIDVVDDIEAGSTLSEAFGQAPQGFDRLYCNMIKAGEAGGALEVILQRLADFKEKAQTPQAARSSRRHGLPGRGHHRRRAPS